MTFFLCWLCGLIGFFGGLFWAGSKRGDGLDD